MYKNRRINKKLLFTLPAIVLLLILSIFVLPFKNGRSIFSNISYSKKVAASIQPNNYDKMKISSAIITERITGRANFNTPNGESIEDGSVLSDTNGNDVSKHDNFIRTFDELIYNIEVRVDRNENTTEPLENLTGGVIKLKVTIPKTSSGIPWLVLNKEEWMNNCQITNNKTVLTADYRIPTTESIIGGNQLLTLRFSAQGITGNIPDDARPKIEVWMEGNKPDNKSSLIDSKEVKDNTSLYVTGVQNFKLTLKEGNINRKETLDGVTGNYINFGAMLSFYNSRWPGIEYPYNGIKSKIKLEYYYRTKGSAESWVKLDRNNASHRQVLDGIRLISYGSAGKSTPGFWPGPESNFYDGLYSGNGTYTGYTYNSGDITASYSNDILSFENHNNYLIGYQSNGWSHFLVDGFELFIPYYEKNSNYEYQIRLNDYELKGYNYYDKEANISVDEKLNINLVNSTEGKIYSRIERATCQGCSTTPVPINENREFKSYIEVEDGPYLGGEERLIVWNSSIAELSPQEGKGIASAYYRYSDGYANLDNVKTKYGIYKSNPSKGVTTNELVNKAKDENFDWYNTIEEAKSHGEIAAMLVNNPDYKGYGMGVMYYFFLKGKNNPDYIGQAQFIKHTIKLFVDSERTQKYTYGYETSYTPTTFDETGNEVEKGSPSSVGHTIVLTGIDLGLVINPRSYKTGEIQTRFNVQDKYLIIELKPIVTKKTTADFKANYSISISMFDGLTYREGSSNVEPTSVKTSSYGGQTLNWKFTNIKTSEVPTIVFQMEMSPFIRNNFSSGSSPDATIFSNAYPTSNGWDRKELSFINLSGSSIRKNINKDIIEANENFEITDTIYNISDDAIRNVKSIEILPKNNDERGNKFSGDYTLKLLEISDNQKFYYTTNSINDIGLTQNSEGKNVIQNVNFNTDSRWHEITKNGIVPANATAIATETTSIDGGKSTSFKYQFIPRGNNSGDKYYFELLASSSNLATAILSDILNVSIVSRNINGIVYVDNDNNNTFSTGDDLLKNHPVKLLDNSGTLIESVETNSNGEYTFKNINKGLYYIDFGQKEEHVLVEKGVGSIANPNGQTDLITDLNVDAKLTNDIILNNLNAGYKKTNATLIVKYVDENGVSIIADEKYGGSVGKKITTSAKEIEGYTLVKKPDKEEYILEDGEQIAIYEYKRIKFKITTKVTNEGGTITGDEEVYYGEDSTKDKIVITPSDKYIINKILINGKEVKPEDLIQLKNVKEDKVIEVSFKISPKNFEEAIDNPETRKESIKIIFALVFLMIIVIALMKIVFKNKISKI